MPLLAESPLTPPAITDLKQRDLNTSFEPKRLLDPQRSQANRRERERVQSITKAYESLLTVTPKDFCEPQLPRIEIVRRAAAYIQYLTDCLQQMETAGALDFPPVFDPTADLSVTAMREGFMRYEFDGCVQRLERKRVVCNGRARVRCKGMKSAFDKLKENVPMHDTEPELSRLSILRRASDYIAYLTLLASEDEAERDKDNVDDEPSKGPSPATSDPQPTRDESCPPGRAGNLTITLPCSEGKDDLFAGTMEPAGQDSGILSLCSLPDNFNLPSIDSDYFSNATSTPTSTISNTTTFSFDCVTSSSSSSETVSFSDELSPSSWLSSDLEALLPFGNATGNDAPPMPLPLAEETFTFPDSSSLIDSLTQPLSHQPSSLYAYQSSISTSAQSTCGPPLYSTSNCLFSFPAAPNQALMNSQTTAAESTTTTSLVGRCEREPMAQRRAPGYNTSYVADLWKPSVAVGQPTLRPPTADPDHRRPSRAALLQRNDLTSFTAPYSNVLFC